MIRVLAADNTALLAESHWEALLTALPAAMHPTILRYRRWQDRQAALLGRWLVREGLRAEGHPGATLEGWQVGPQGKPKVADDIFFNLSHTDGLVVCAVTRHGEIGIDCERIRAIDLHDFQRLFPPAAWQAIVEAPDPPHAFFDAWTRREALLKADGRGLSFPLEQLRISSNRATLEANGPTWSLLPVAVPPGWCCHVALACPDEHAAPPRLASGDPDPPTTLEPVWKSDI
ncbi:MAG: 4'-phosphopantetheinyl transferase superfamily protein [Magnetococcales bacterium]|nr:4'-phosphopantetheinyl transferase superfamily protein [Magnetococcales bacterium]